MKRIQLLIVLFLIYSILGCKNELGIEQQKAEHNGARIHQDVNLPPDIKSIQRVFKERNYLEKFTTIIADTIKLTWEPKWDHYTINRSTDSTAFVFINLNPKAVVIKDSRVIKSNFEYKLFLIVKKSKDGNHEFFEGTYISDDRNEPIKFPEFSGTLFMRDLLKKDVKRFTYKNSILIPNPKPVAEKNNAKISQEIICAELVRCFWYTHCEIGILGTTGHFSCPFPLEDSGGCASDNGWMYMYSEVLSVDCWVEPTSDPWNPADPGDPGFPVGWHFFGHDPITYFDMNYYVPEPHIKFKDAATYLDCLISTVVPGSSINLRVVVDRPYPNSYTPFNPTVYNHPVGHTFLEIEKTLPAGAPFYSQKLRKSIGFYPNASVGPNSITQEGRFGADDVYSGSTDLAVNYSITESQLSTIVSYISGYISVSNPNYDVFTRNCGNFVSDVLDQIGIYIPNAWSNTLWYVYSYPGIGVINQTGPSMGKFAQTIDNYWHPSKQSTERSLVSPKPNINCP